MKVVLVPFGAGGAGDGPHPGHGDDEDVVVKPV